ncbi:MAG: hypothetical protein WC953_10640 [Pseudomonas sp.]
MQVVACRRRNPRRLGRGGCQVHCDLKSYAKGTIRPASVKAAIESLAKQVACAEKSDSWRDFHGHDHVTASICGLLFVYNHDGEYEADFQKNLIGINPESLQLPRGSKETLHKSTSAT